MKTEPRMNETSHLDEGVPAGELCGEHIGLEVLLPETTLRPCEAGWSLLVSITHSVGGVVNLEVGSTFASRTRTLRLPTATKVRLRVTEMVGA